MIGVENIEGWRGQQVIDPAGEQLGKLDEVYLDRETGTPLLLAVRSGLLGRHTKLIPIDGATVSRDFVRVVHDKEIVDGAPNGTGDDAPGGEELDALGSAYGLRFSDRVTLEGSSAAEARRAEAAAAREHADQLAREAQAKIAERDAAQDAAHGAHEQAGQAEREADQARERAMRAREEADRHGHDA